MPSPQNTFTFIDDYFRSDESASEAYFQNVRNALRQRATGHTIPSSTGTVTNQRPWGQETSPSGPVRDALGRFAPRSASPSNTTNTATANAPTPKAKRKPKPGICGWFQKMDDMHSMSA
jgi:hypothetical protein